MSDNIKSSELYNRQIASCNNELMQQVWAGTPWMINFYTGSVDSSGYREIMEWCREHIGEEAFPLHRIPGNWQSGSAIVYGNTWLGFKTEEMMNQFFAQWKGE